MNQNMLISTALISSLWDTHHKDTLDLMLPFLKYAIAKKTAVGQQLNIDDISTLFKEEFGYESIPRNVLLLMLNRLSPDTVSKKRDNYVLVTSLDADLASFERQRTLYKERRNQVGTSLADYLNQHLSKIQASFTCETALSALIAFFAEKGLIVSQTPEQLALIKRDDKDRTIHCIARFIISEQKSDSVLFDYIVDMVKGFFVSTAISLQPENSTLPHSKFKKLKCYLDTPIILNVLGLRLPSAQIAAQELLDMLESEQAEICCFEHTVKEIREIIRAYKFSLASPGTKNAHNTLEHWDEINYSIDSVARYLTLIESKIAAKNIKIIPSPAKRSTWIKGLRYTRFVEYLQTKIPYGSDSAREYDILSVMGVMRLRDGHTAPDIETCGHIFITTNIPLITAVNKNLINAGEFVPPVMTDATMSSIVWFKCSQTHQNYPKYKLIENAMLALEPTNSLLKEFYTTIDQMTADGGISNEEASVIRSDIQIKRELAVAVNGDATQIDQNIVEQLRESLRKRYIGEDKSKSEENYQKYIQQKAQNDKALREIILNIDSHGSKWRAHTIKALTILAYIILGAMFLGLIGFSIAAFVISKSYWVGAIALLITDCIGFYDLTFGKKQVIQNWINKIADIIAEKAMERKQNDLQPIIDTLQATPPAKDA